MEQDRTARNRERRHAVFKAVHEVLKREEQDWALVLEHVAEAERAKVREQFEWTWGVRSAGEVAVGHLATKLLVIERRLAGAFVWPERSCRGGRMDLWIGDDRDSDGLGVEFKFLMRLSRSLDRPTAGSAIAARSEC